MLDGIAHACRAVVQHKGQVPGTVIADGDIAVLRELTVVVLHLVIFEIARFERGEVDHGLVVILVVPAVIIHAVARSELIRRGVFHGHFQIIVLSSHAVIFTEALYFNVIPGVLHKGVVIHLNGRITAAVFLPLDVPINAFLALRSGYLQHIIGIVGEADRGNHQFIDVAERLIVFSITIEPILRGIVPEICPFRIKVMLSAFDTDIGRRRTSVCSVLLTGAGVCIIYFTKNHICNIDILISNAASGLNLPNKHTSIQRLVLICPRIALVIVHIKNGAVNGETIVIGKISYNHALSAFRSIVSCTSLINRLMMTIKRRFVRSAYNNLFKSLIAILQTNYTAESGKPIICRTPTSVDIYTSGSLFKFDIVIHTDGYIANIGIHINADQTAGKNSAASIYPIVIVLQVIHVAHIVVICNGYVCYSGSFRPACVQRRGNADQTAECGRTCHFQERIEVSIVL